MGCGKESSTFLHSAICSLRFLLYGHLCGALVLCLAFFSLLCLPGVILCLALLLRDSNIYHLRKCL